MCANIVTEDTKAGGWKKKGAVLSNSDSQSTAHQIGNCEENKENIGLLAGTMTDSIGICESRSKVFDVKAAYSRFLRLIIRLRHTLDRRVQRIDSEKVMSKPSLLEEMQGMDICVMHSLCTEILLSKHKKAICIVPVQPLRSSSNA